MECAAAPVGSPGTLPIGIPYRKPVFGSVATASLPMHVQLRLCSRYGGSEKSGFRRCADAVNPSSLQQGRAAMLIPLTPLPLSSASEGVSTADTLQCASLRQVCACPPERDQRTRRGERRGKARAAPALPVSPWDIWRLPDRPKKRLGNWLSSNNFGHHHCDLKSSSI